MADTAYQPISIEHDGVQFKFLDEGESDVAVILLHGLSYDKWWATPLIERLKGTYRCIAPDLPGHNGIPHDEIFDVAGFAEYVKKLMDFLELKHVFLIGFSLGGLVSLKFAERYPNDPRLKGVIAWASPVISGEKSQTLMTRVLLSLLDRMSKVVFDVFTSKPVLKALVKVTKIYLPPSEINSVSNFQYEPYKDLIPVIYRDTYQLSTPIPTLCIFGTGNKMISSKNLKYALEHKGENCIVEKVKLGGHYAFGPPLQEVYAKMEVFLKEMTKLIPEMKQAGQKNV